MNSGQNPYSSPAAPNEPSFDATQSAVGVKHPFDSAGPRATFAVAMLGISIFLDALSMISSMMQVQLLNQISQGRDFTDAELDMNDGREALIGLAGIVCYLVTATAFLFWFHRVHRNLPALGATNLKYSPGWAVGSFFIPILNLFRPFQIMKEVWEHSLSSSAHRFSSLVGLWWAAWIIANIVGQIGFRLAMNAESVDTLIAGTWATAFQCLVSIVAGVLAIQVVRSITRMQEDRFDNMIGRSTI